MKKHGASYRHGGGYKRASLDENINWRFVTDYSTSINWKAPDFYPDELIYIHRENIEYPEPDYTEIKEIISKVYGYPEEHFILTNGANEGISYLFHMFLLLEYKQAVLVGPTYSEYNKCCDLNGFESYKISYEELFAVPEKISNKIVIIVNPNTPFGEYKPIKDLLVTLLNQGNTVVLDESFIDFTDKPSMFELIKNYPDLFIIKSMTKFYGSAGARFGLILSSNSNLKEFLQVLIPPWNISAYNNWFYKLMLPRYSEIKKATLEWISDINNKADEVLTKSANIKALAESITSYRTLEINDKFLKHNNIKNCRKFLLNNYKIFIRPTPDFFGCPENSFRVGLRLPDENEPLWKFIEDIG